MSSFPKKGMRENLAYFDLDKDDFVVAGVDDVVVDASAAGIGLTEHQGKLLEALRRFEVK
jgi:hypothetical protein